MSPVDSINNTKSITKSKGQQKQVAVSKHLDYLSKHVDYLFIGIVEQ